MPGSPRSINTMSAWSASMAGSASSIDPKRAATPIAWRLVDQEAEPLPDLPLILDDRHSDGLSHGSLMRPSLACAVDQSPP